MEKRHQGKYGKFSPCSNHKEHTGCSANNLHMGADENDVTIGFHLP